MERFIQMCTKKKLAFNTLEDLVVANDAGHIPRCLIIGWEQRQYHDNPIDSANRSISLGIVRKKHRWIFVPLGILCILAGIALGIFVHRDSEGARTLQLFLPIITGIIILGWQAGRDVEASKIDKNQNWSGGAEAFRESICVYLRLSGLSIEDLHRDDCESDMIPRVFDGLVQNALKVVKFERRYKRVPRGDWEVEWMNLRRTLRSSYDKMEELGLLGDGMDYPAIYNKAHELAGPDPSTQ